MKLKNTNYLENGSLLFVYGARNAITSRKNHCKLAVVKSGTSRPRTFDGIDKVALISWTQTASLNGDVVLSNDVCQVLGIKRTDILLHKFKA